MSNVINPADLPQYVGKEVGVSDWVLVDQTRIDQFAQATGDFQFIHVDPARAAATPFGSTIAHGFLTLSLMSMLGSEHGSIKLQNTIMGINYGLDKVRFITPVKVGSRIRARFELLEAKEKKPGYFLMKHNVTVEIEGESKPALIAEWLGMTVVERSA
ncbi:MAG: hypothetical protein RLZZ385_2181 [Pseudomonadota bacterium]|jgi:acyl dehydratase